MKYDAHTMLVIATVSYFLLLAVLNGIIAVSGAVPLETYISAHTLVFVNIVMGLIYLGYVSWWRGRVFLAYERTDWKKFALFAAVGAVLHVVLFVAQMSTVSSLALALYNVLLGSSYAFVAITENAFFIGVVGDYVAERLGRDTRGNVIAAVVAALFAGLVAAVFHVGVYGYSPVALAIVMFWFGYWTFASLESGSTLYADLHHMIGNYFGFIYSAVEVVA